MNAFADLLIQFGHGSHIATEAHKRFPNFAQCTTYGDEWRSENSSHPSLQRPNAHLQYMHRGAWQIWRVGEISSYLPKEDNTLPLDAFFDDIIHSRSKPEALNGHFIIFARNSEIHQWHVWTNRFGTLHAYYATDGKRAALGTFFPAVAAAASRRQLDWQGLTGFCAFGFFPQDRTYFEDVRILRPASHYTFDEAGQLLYQERYWQWHHHPDLHRSYDDTVVEFRTILDAVMGDSVRQGTIALPISGGLDSRTTVASITSIGRDQSSGGGLWPYSYGYSEDSVETRIGRKVAEARKLPFQAFTLRPYLFDHLDLILSSVEGFQDVTQCRQAAVVSDLAPYTDYVIAAHWGDVWMDDMGLSRDSHVLSDEDILHHTQHKIEKGGHAWLLKHLCSPRLNGDAPDYTLREMIRGELESVRQIKDPDFRVKAFKTDQWSFRWTTASLRMFQPAAFPRLPFYDTRMADFFCTVPSEFVRGRRLQIDYLKRYAPDLAKITWQTYDANLFQYQHFNTWQLPKRAIKRAWRMATRQPVVERNWEIQFLNPNGRQGLDKWLLHPGLRLHDLVSPKAIRPLLDAFYAAPLEQKRGYTISMLLTLSAWLERYGG